jgi:hypothetical protein
VGVIGARGGGLWWSFGAWVAGGLSSRVAASSQTCSWHASTHMQPACRWYIAASAVLLQALRALLQQQRSSLTCGCCAPSHVCVFLLCGRCHAAADGLLLPKKFDLFNAVYYRDHCQPDPYVSVASCPTVQSVSPPDRVRVLAWQQLSSRVCLWPQLSSRGCLWQGSLSFVKP